MELYDVMRTTSAIRKLRSEPIPLDLIYEVLDNARFAPNGSNRQGWRVIVVTDPGLRMALSDLYSKASTILRAEPNRPQLTHPAEAAKGEPIERLIGGAGAAAQSFRESLHEAPVHLLITVNLGFLSVTDRHLQRHSIVGGASVYPFVQNLLLSLRNVGLGSVLTTVIAAVEPEVQELLGIPEEYAVVALLPVGWPAVSFPSRLRRVAVEQFATCDRFDGPPLKIDSPESST
jgi:nitroreductase